MSVSSIFALILLFAKNKERRDREMMGINIEVGQCWIHKLTALKYRVVDVDGDEVLLDPEGEGQELTLSQELLIQEFHCPEFRKHNNKPRRKIKPGKIRRGLRK